MGWFDASNAAPMDRDVSILRDLQDGLLAHFRSLARVRERSSFPIFALEHGLRSADIEHINALLHARPRYRRSLMPHWLLWTVCASEAGYEYMGDEYWPSFEKRAPDWQYHDRPKLKSCFQRFQKSFNGVVPCGPWAEQFSIIAWPITHALLPRYLQPQFAKLLYDLRFRLASSSSLDTSSIGRLLAANAPQASTRFEAFLQQEELTGQIVAALLRGESSDTGELIHGQTLRRIVEDLERVRNSRQWLKETKRVVQDRFKGIGRTSGSSSIAARDRPDKPNLSEAARLAIRPDIFLRYASTGNCSVLVQMKSLRPLAAANKELCAFLNQTRCRLNGAADWKPKRWLLSSNRKGALKRWPHDAAPLIEFEHPHPLMDHLLESECRLPPGPIWLFRIGNDGLARHIASCTVRPSYHYIVVTATSMPQEPPDARECALECAGVRAFLLIMPDHVDADTTKRLRDFGLAVARTIRVWPAGLPGRGWDGEGSSEWLTTESPCFGIAPDHQIDALSFRLNGDQKQVLETARGSPTFVQLPRLRAGTHTLTVEAHRSTALDDAVSTPPAKGTVRLAVREPEPWTPGITSHTGLIVTTDPHDAKLDVLWRNELDLSVVGPDNFAVSIHVRLHAPDGGQILSDRVGPPIHLPVTPNKWREAFTRFLDNESRAWKYIEATSCTLEINGDSLGTCALRFDHDAAPLHWVMVSRQQQIIIRLVDDTGKHDTAPDIHFYSMEHPLDCVRLDPEALRKGQVVEPPGGLFVARHGNFADTAVVSAPPRAGLRDVGVQPNIDIGSGPRATRDASRVLCLWHGARWAGFLAELRRREVTEGLINAIIRTICGQRWSKAETDFGKQLMSRHAIEALESLVDRHTRFGPCLSRQTERNASKTVMAANFTTEARRLGISRDIDLCHFALRLAGRQADVLAAPLLDSRVGQLADNPSLLRGARLVLLLCERYGDSLAATPQSNPRT